MASPQGTLKTPAAGARGTLETPAAGGTHPPTPHPVSRGKRSKALKDKARAPWRVGRQQVRDFQHRRDTTKRGRPGLRGRSPAQQRGDSDARGLGPTRARERDGERAVSQRAPSSRRDSPRPERGGACCLAPPAGRRLAAGWPRLLPRIGAGTPTRRRLATPGRRRLTREGQHNAYK